MRKKRFLSLVRIGLFLLTVVFLFLEWFLYSPFDSFIALFLLLFFVVISNEIFKVFPSMIGILSIEEEDPLSNLIWIGSYVVLLLFPIGALVMQLPSIEGIRFYHIFFTGGILFLIIKRIKYLKFHRKD